MNVSFSHFIDFCLAHGRERVRIVREIRAGQDSRFDLYAPLRRALIDVHAEHKPIETVEAMAATRVDPIEHRHFKVVVAGYRKFMKRTPGVWFEPPMRDYPIGPVVVRVDPELGLRFGGSAHVLKMYLRATPIERLRVELATTLLQMSLGEVWPGVVWSVLDARRGRFHDYKPATIPVTKANVALLHSEACAFGSLWTNV